MSSVTVARRLIALELTRTLTPGAVLAFLICTVLLARGGGGEDWSALERTATPLSSALATRESLCGGALVFLAVWMLLHAAGTAARWREEESGFFGARPFPLQLLVLSAGAAWGIALALLLLPVVALGLVHGGLGQPSWRYAGSQSLASPMRVAPGEEHVFALVPPASAERLRVGIALARTVGGGGAHEGAAGVVSVELRDAAGRVARAEARFATRTRLELELDRSVGALELRLANTGESSVALLDERSFEYWTGAGRAGRGLFEWAGRTWMALVLACGLALALGAWMKPGLAVALGAAAWLETASLAGARRWLPGVRIERDLELLRVGRLAEAVDLRWWTGSAAFALLTLVLAVAGLRGWSQRT